MKENQPRTHQSSQNFDRNRDGDRDFREPRGRDRSDSSDRDRRDGGYRHKPYEKPKSGRFLFVFGQLFGLVYNLAVLYFVYFLVQNGNESLALKIFAINAGVMMSAIFLSMLERRLFPRAKFDRNRKFNRR